MSVAKDIDGAVAELASLVAEIHGPLARSITVDIQASGECPYRIEVVDAVFPEVGVAYVPELSDFGRKTSAPKPKQPGKGA